MKVKKLINTIDDFAPFFLQEGYDNSGLQFGDLDAEITRILIALETTTDAVMEAKRIGANVILAHHPILFNATKSIVKQNMPTLFLAATSNINLIAVHTNFDISENGLNDYVGELLGIKKESPIQISAEKIFKFAVYVPDDYADRVRDALFSAGAGKIGNYSDSSFNINGISTFTPLEGTRPFIGEEGRRSYVKETKIETVVSERFLPDVIAAMQKNHPYEEPAYDVYMLSMNSVKNGIGMVGNLDKEFSALEFSYYVKDKLGADYVRFIGDDSVKIKKVALCTGSGGSLMDLVKNMEVDLFITGDIGYHTAIHAKELGINILDVEHFDTEKFFVDAMYNSLLKEGIDKELVTKYNSGSPYKLIK